ncbi:MAG: AAA family ATPase [Chloroflexi bacterium]|nr:AAA family ATPase [Chloroflexota bacterium]
MLSLNPFIYGKPVPVAQHINRQRELRTLFARLRNGECTAIVGEPRIGKTSLLRCLATPAVQQEWLAGEAKRLISVEIDFYQEWLSPDKTPKDFWQRVLEVVKIATPHETIQQQITLVEENLYGSATLSNFFRNLDRQGWRVVLLLDEFDALLTHPNFSTAEFFGGLRSMATRTDGLQVITASIMSVSEMNRRSETINPVGSPFFNNFTEVNLGPFSHKDVAELLDLALAESNIRFDRDDRNFIVWLSGRHPYRVQAAGAALFDAIAEGLQGQKRYTTASELFYEWTADHFDTLWRRYLDDAARTVMVILALVELGGIAQKRAFSFGEIEQPQRFAPELRRLEKLGLVEKAGQGWQWDQENLLLWQGERWRVATGGFVWWLADVIIGGTRNIPDFEKWLHEQEVQGYLLTRKQWSTLREWSGKIPQSVVGGVGALARQFVAELLARKGK